MDIEAARTGGQLVDQIVALDEKLAVLNDAMKREACIVNLTLVFKFPLVEGAEEEPAKPLSVGDLTSEASQSAIGLAIKIFQAQRDALNEQLAAL
jgi:hypothetical protein